MVVDYRKLNKNIEIDSVPLPDLHSAVDWFGGAKFFTIFDLNSAYHLIPLAEESRPYTTFCVPWNVYKYTRVPMGLAVGAQTITRLLMMSSLILCTIIWTISSCIVIVLNPILNTSSW